MKTSITKNNLISLGSIFLTLVIWQVAAYYVNWELKLPSPVNTANRILEIIRDKDFFLAVGSTLSRALISFSVTMIFGTILGFIAGLNRVFELIFDPIVTFVKSTPTIAVILFVLIWMDYHIAPLIVGGLIVFPIVYNNVLHGLRDVDKQLIEMGTVFGFSRSQMIKSVYLPSIRKFLYASVLTGVGLNIKVVIAAEVLGGSGISIGRNLQYARANVDTVSILAWIFIIVTLVAIVDAFVKKFKVIIE